MSKKLRWFIAALVFAGITKILWIHTAGDITYNQYAVFSLILWVSAGFLHWLEGLILGAYGASSPAHAGLSLYSLVLSLCGGALMLLSKPSWWDEADWEKGRFR